jgi:RHS repeat-associated protein
VRSGASHRLRPLFAPPNQLLPSTRALQLTSGALHFDQACRAGSGSLRKKRLVVEMLRFLHKNAQSVSQMGMTTAAKTDIASPPAPLLACACLAQNLHQGHRLPTALLHQGFAPRISNTTTGLDVFLYDSARRSRSTSKERDAETGLDFFESRYYSSAQGRFTSPDEFKGGFLDAFSGQAAFQPGPLPYADISDPQTLNKYAYVRNNPLRYTDPNGHCFWDLCIGEGIGLYAAGTAAVAGAAYLMTPQGKEATRAFIVGTGLLINKAVDGIGNLLSSGSTQTQPTTSIPGVPAQAPAGVQGPIQASDPLVGNNPRDANGRTNTDLPGGHGAATDTFGQLTQGQGVRADPRTGQPVSETGIRLRLNPDGTARVDVPKSATRPKHETVHFNDPDKLQDQQ